jgi:hypothetical protein
VSLAPLKIGHGDALSLINVIGHCYAIKWNCPKSTYPLSLKTSCEGDELRCEGRVAAAGTVRTDQWAQSSEKSCWRRKKIVTVKTVDLAKE